MSCGKNALIETLDETRNEIGAAMASGRSLFDKTKSNIENTIADVSDSVNGIIDGAKSALSDKLSGAIGAISNIKVPLPNVSSLAIEAVSLIGAGPVQIAAFVAKWSGKPGADIVISKLQEGPIAFADWIDSIDPCKDLPNTKINEDNAETVEAPTEATPPSNKPEPPEVLKPTVESSTEKPSSGGSNVVESTVRQRWAIYTRAVNNVSAVLDLNTIKNIYSDAKKTPEASALFKKCNKQSISLSEYAKSPKATNAEIAIVNQLKEYESDYSEQSLIVKNTLFYGETYERLVGRQATIDESFHDNYRVWFQANNAIAYFNEMKSLVESNSALIVEYYKYIGINA